MDVAPANQADQETSGRTLAVAIASLGFNFSPSHFRFMTVDDKPHHKPSILHQVCSNGYKTSTDLLRRARGISKSRYTAIEQDGAVGDEKRTLMADDPCDTLVENVEGRKTYVPL